MQCVRMLKPIIEEFPQLAKAYRYLRDIRRLREIPKETPMGFRLLGNIEMERGMFEPEETVLAQKLLKQVDVFINIGANIGYYCCMALYYGKYSVAFEPIQINLLYLYKNIKANHCENNIEIFPIALSDKVGIIDIYGGGTGASLIKGWAGMAAHDFRQVPTSTMDNVLGSRFQGKKCFILVDIEGAEMYMLGGAGSFLNRHPKPIWMVEISIFEHQPKGIQINPNLLSTFKIFWDNGYEAWTAGKVVRSIHPDEIKAINRTGHDTLFTHNFLFFEQGGKENLLDSL